MRQQAFHLSQRPVEYAGARSSVQSWSSSVVVGFETQTRRQGVSPLHSSTPTGQACGFLQCHTTCHATQRTTRQTMRHAMWHATTPASQTWCNLHAMKHILQHTMQHHMQYTTMPTGRAWCSLSFLALRSHRSSTALCVRLCAQALVCAHRPLRACALVRTRALVRACALVCA